MNKLCLGLIAVLCLQSFPARADAGIDCKTDDKTGAITCAGVLEAAEKIANCAQKNTVMAGGHLLQTDKPGCDDIPEIDWTVNNDGSFSVIVDPRPSPQRLAETTVEAAALQDYALTKVLLTYLATGNKPQRFACTHKDDGTFRCDVSTQFIYLKCNESLNPDMKIVTQVAEIYQKSGTEDRLFKNPVANFGYPKLARLICAAKHTVAGNAGTPPKKE